MTGSAITQRARKSLNTTVFRSSWKTARQIGHAFHVDGVEELTTIIETCATRRLDPRETQPAI